MKTTETVFLFSARGGSLLEMDYRPQAFNILGTLSRREEGYHQKLIESRQEAAEGRTRTIHEIFDSKEKDLDQYLQFDSYRRASFLDHFIAAPMDFESFRRCRYQEEGDFISGLYDIEAKEKGGNREVLFSRIGKVFKEGEGKGIRVEKKFVPSLDQKILKATYRLSFLGEEKARTNFGIEFNINLLAGDASDRYYRIPGAQLEDRRLASTGELENVLEVHLIDEWNGFEVFLKTDKNGSLWRFPIETVSLSESGFEKIFQGSCLLFYWPLDLEPKKQFEMNM